MTYRALGANGRLGNQLWQIAATIGLAYHYDEPVNLPPWDYQPYFSLPGDLFTGPRGTDATELAEHLPPEQRPYLQDLTLIEGVEELLRVWLEPSAEAQAIIAPLAYDIDADASHAVHVRRGDYAEEWRGHGMLPASWYEANWPDGPVLVFTDDPKWCEANLPGRVVHNDDDWIDWHLMSRCRDHLISNSTFAWWAAWKSRRHTIYPDPWFTGLPYGSMFEPWWTPQPRDIKEKP